MIGLALPGVQVEPAPAIDRLYRRRAIEGLSSTP